jgi:hypothetical protein
MAMGFVKNIRRTIHQADVRGFWHFDNKEEGVPGELLNKPVMMYFPEEGQNDFILAVDKEQVTFMLNIKEPGQFSRFTGPGRDYLEIPLPEDEFLPVDLSADALFSNPVKWTKYMTIGCLAVVIIFALIIILAVWFG